MKKSLWIATALVVAGIAVGGVFALRCKTCDKSDTSEKTQLRLRWLPQSQFAGVYLADKEGIFAREGLEVTINPGGPGINFIQTVGSGSEDFGIAGAAQIIEARDKGMPVVALAIIFQGNPNVFFAKKSSGIRTPSDWPGKTVAVYHGFDIDYMYRAILKRKGIDGSKIKEYPAKFDMAPFFRDEVDIWAGYAINQPNTAEEKGFEVVRWSPDEFGIHVAGDTLFTTTEVLEKNPEMVRRMVFSVLDGWHRALREPGSTVEMMLTVDSKLDRVHETKMLASVDELTRTAKIGGKIGWMATDQWKEMVTLWKEFGGIKGTVDPAECFNNSFVEAYYAGPGKRWLAQ